ncbi:MAG: hypothetical protein ACRDKB_04505 [Actinomycetota bacterium]
MKRVAALAVGALLAATLPGVAGADDHVPPRAVLRVDDHTQRGRLSHSTWLRATPDPDECIAVFADGLGWPQALAYDSTYTPQAAITLHKSAVPVEVRLEAWIESDGQGNPVGPALRLPYVLRADPSPFDPRRWTLVFAPPPSDVVFLELEASWRDEDGCTDFTDLGEQYGAWRFKLRHGTCTRASTAARVRSFIRAYNRGNLERLERMWAQEPDFQWYVVDDERESRDAENRHTLGTYFNARHQLNDRIRLRRIRVSPTSEDGSFGFGFKLFRTTDDSRKRAEGLFHGKGAVTQGCLLHVWAMDNDDS